MTVLGFCFGYFFDATDIWNILPAPQRLIRLVILNIFVEEFYRFWNTVRARVQRSGVCWTKVGAAGKEHELDEMFDIWTQISR